MWTQETFTAALRSSCPLRTIVKSGGTPRLVAYDSSEKLCVTSVL